MNTTTKYIAGAFGAIALFVSTFICAAAMSGTPLHELAVVGGLFPEPTRASLTASDPAPRIQAEVRPASEILRNQLSILGSFRMPSEMTSDAILMLQEDLRTRTAALAERESLIDQKQKEVSERESALGERWDELAGLRGHLQDWEEELDQRSRELDRDEAVLEEDERRSWRALADMYAVGDAALAGARLATFEPAEVAQILAGLDSDRASALLAALPASRYRAFLDAYRTAIR
jgi:flagellar motility protein MotE (MotC chaperone)